ncbi:MAG: transaldolase [Planctomycetaceae bacterium]|nr:transaldolase [Planctomycetaceae bacterium]
MTPLKSLIDSGTKLWLDSVEPELVRTYHSMGATGATSNPIIIAGIINTGQCDARLEELLKSDMDDNAIAWQVTDELVQSAQNVFRSIWDESNGNDGYVSFELDPLLEATDCPLSISERIERYVELGKKWSNGHQNRMIKVPATPAGLGAVEPLIAAGVPLNITLLFSERQYLTARDAVWRGAQQRSDTNRLKAVFSIFVSRIDGYISKHVTNLSSAAEREVAISNAQRLWKLNQDFWSDKPIDLDQDIVFASMGTKLAGDPPDRYVSALAGSDIQTNPPETNEAVAAMEGKTFTRAVDKFLSNDILAEIQEKVDFARMETFLMEEGLAKFAQPQQLLLKSIADKRAAH